MEMNVIYNENCLTGLQKFPDNYFNCCVTSPPYWKLRDYGVSGQLGQEVSPDLYVANMVKVFREVRRTLQPDGTLWLNVGDCFYSNNRGHTQPGALCLKDKDLIGIPWLLAFALRSDGWYLRSDIVWAKKNCIPESIRDRPTRSHEFIFLLSKSKRYYYDGDAIKERAIYDVNREGTISRKVEDVENHKGELKHNVSGTQASGFKMPEKFNGKYNDKQYSPNRMYLGFDKRWEKKLEDNHHTGMRNKRDVWTMPTARFPGGHYATFPEILPYTCILAGSPPGGVVLDPFSGAGTTALVARKLQRNYVGFELNPSYVKMTEERLRKDLGMFL